MKKNGEGKVRGDILIYIREEKYSHSNFASHPSPFLSHSHSSIFPFLSLFLSPLPSLPFPFSLSLLPTSLPLPFPIPSSPLDFLLYPQGGGEENFIPLIMSKGLNQLRSKLLLLKFFLYLCMGSNLCPFARLHLQLRLETSRLPLVGVPLLAHRRHPLRQLAVLSLHAAPGNLHESYRLFQKSCSI